VSNLFPDEYEALVQEDIDWLLANTEQCLERGHIVQILRCSVEEYRRQGYDEVMSRTGWRYARHPAPQESGQ
jgi:hypothetical protein